MYIVPQSIFKIIRNVPFNNDYKHTIWFTNASAQLTYFESKVAQTFTDFTYVRQDKIVRVSTCADNIYDCNYCMFKNLGFGNKWFFGFITKVEYANNDVAFLTIEIDYVQTWLFDFHFNTSLVEREHVSDDTIGKHTVDEELPIGSYISKGNEEVPAYYNPAVAVYATVRAGGDEYRMTNGVFSSMATLGFNPATELADLKRFMNVISVAPELISMIVMCVTDMLSSGTVTDDNDNNCGHFLKAFNDQKTITRNLTNIFSFRGDNYTPRNNKLYCYPYSFIVGSNGSGASQVYRWEDFDTADSGATTQVTSASFQVVGVAQPKPCMGMYPVNYRKLGAVPSKNNYGLQFDNFPLCPYNIDTFYAWASQSLPQGLGNIAGTIGVASGNMYQGSGNTVVDQMVYGQNTEGSSLRSNLGALALGASTASLAVQMWQHELHSTAIGGTVGNAGMTYYNERIGFLLEHYTIKPEYARIIDDYFTRFGYRINRYKIPELTSRQSFNYVKTIECNIDGNIPNEANKMLCNIFNSGITLWHTVNVGNYSLNNNIVGE